MSTPKRFCGLNVLQIKDLVFATCVRKISSGALPLGRDNESTLPSHLINARGSFMSPDLAKSCTGQKS